jgi:KDO2-lipid IV(A) lauroyltransferase
MWYFGGVESAKPFRHLLDAPWFYRLGFAAGKAVPKAILYRIADLVGDASRVGYPVRAESVRANMRCVFPDAPPGEIARLTKGVFRNFTRSLVDYGRFRSMAPDAIFAEVTAFEGMDNLMAALEIGRKKGCVLVTGHIGNWELGSFLFRHYDMKTNVVTVREGRPEIDALREAHRVDHHVRTITMDGSPFVVIEMMAALKRGEVVAMVIDRWGADGAVHAPFFGHDHPFPAGPFALSRATGATMLSACVVREKAGYKVIIDPPFEATGDPEPHARRVAESLERIIRRYPDQWYNFTPVGQAAEAAAKP